MQLYSNCRGSFIGGHKTHDPREKPLWPQRYNDETFVATTLQKKHLWASMRPENNFVATTLQKEHLWPQHYNDETFVATNETTPAV